MFIPRKLFVVKHEHIPGVQHVLYSEPVQSAQNRVENVTRNSSDLLRVFIYCLSQ